MTIVSGMQRRIADTEPFDRLIGVVFIGLIAAIVGVIALGDQAGVGVQLIDPATDSGSGTALTVHSTWALHLRFTEPMNTASVHLRFAPVLDGVLTGSGTQLTFTPTYALTPGTVYTMSIQAGAQSARGRTVQQSATWTLTVALPTILYLAPAIRDRTNIPINLWQITSSGTPIQITHSDYGVDDFAPSPDGMQVAFSQRNSSGKTDLYLLSTTTDKIRQITRCVDAPCRAPSWSPDGGRLVYERADTTRPDSDVRAWVLDLSTLQTVPLLTDSRWLGKTPRWSPDGKTISLFDHNEGGIFLVDVATGSESFIQTLEDDAGQFAPAAHQQLVYRELVMAPQGALRRLAVADFGSAAHTLRPLPSPDGALTDDTAALWNPDGQHLVVMRRYIDDPRATPEAQVYEVDATTGEARPLVVDPMYAHGYLSWRPDGGQLLMQRYPFDDPNGQTGIWVYDAASKALRQVAHNGFFPQWLP